MVTVAKTDSRSESASRMTAALFLRSGEAPVSDDRELLQRALEFVNQRADQAERFIPWQMKGGDHPFVDEWRRNSGSTNPDMMPSFGPLATRRRDQLRECLLEFLQAPEVLVRRFETDLSDRLQNVTIRPTWRLSGRGAARTVFRSDEVWPLSWPDLLAYIVLLLLDEGKGLGGALCRCRLDTCGQFFLAKKPATGRPRRDYHSDKCMLEAHARQSTQRAMKSRARKATKAKKAK